MDVHDVQPRPPLSGVRGPRTQDTCASSPIEVLLLDVGGVLVPFADPMLVQAVARKMGREARDVGVLLYECEAWYALSTGKIDEDDYWRLIAEQAGQERERIEHLLRPVWELGPTRPDEEVVALARAVRPPVRVAILSNNTLRLEEYLRSCGVDAIFDLVINSARVGLRKPDPRIFLHALEKLHVAPQAVLFVDDKRRNTQVAEELGMPSVCFDGAARLRAALLRYGVLPPEAI